MNQMLGSFKLQLKSNFHNAAVLQGKANSVLKPSDATPRDADYVRVIFRMLTATMVNAHNFWATDFTNEEVLRESIPLILNKPAYIDHNTWSVTNNIGIVEDAYWVEASIDSMGNLIPAGIEGVFKVDAKKWPDVARDLQAEVPSIQSASVTVKFEFEKSHEFEDKWDFYWYLGEVREGKMVCRRVTKILDYQEVSLVSLGADPFAKIKHNGELLNVEHSAVFVDEPTPASTEVSAGFASFGKQEQHKLAQYFLQNPELKEINEKYVDAEGKMLDVGQKLVFTDEQGTRKVALSLMSVIGNEAQKFEIIQEAMQETLSASKSALEESIVSWKQKAVEYQTELDNLKKQIITQKDDANLMQTQVLKNQELEVEIGELKVTKTTLEQQVLALQEQSEEKNQQLQERFDKIQSYHTKNTNLQNEKARLLADKSALEGDLDKVKKELDTQKTSFEAANNFANGLIDQKRKEAVRLFKLGAIEKGIPEGEQEAMITHIEQMGWEALQAYHQDKGGDFFEENQFSCPHCNKEITQLKSSKATDKEEKTNQKKSGNKTMMDIDLP